MTRKSSATQTNYTLTDRRDYAIHIWWDGRVDAGPQSRRRREYVTPRVLRKVESFCKPRTGKTVIYVDPPYNTSRKDFRYNDRWVKEDAPDRHSGGSFLSENDARMVFGLGGAKQADRVEVRWQSGTTSEFTDVPAGSYYLAVEGETQLKTWSAPPPTQTQK